jgi:hypothetical protein
MEERNMKKPAFLILLCFGSQAQAPHRIGAIDSVSIPDSILNFPRESAISIHMRDHSQPPSEAEIQSIQDKRVCAALSGAISRGVRDRAKTELGVFASDAEVEAFRKNLFATAPPSKDGQARSSERLQALLVGLTAVYEQGRDPQQVYQQLVAPHNISKEDWAQNLYLGRTKEERQKLARKLAANTPEAFAKSETNYDARPAVEIQKINAAVDALLAASDPKFKAYLSEWNASMTHPRPNGTRFNVSTGVKDYLEQKRAAWWKAETAKLNVTLSDPSLYAACGLPAMGVTVPRQ